jgi:DNA-binding response OmpR family regulator
MADTPPDSAPLASAPVSAEEARPRVLIVDDIFDNRAILGRRFERRGFEVAEADSGARALELINTQPYDVVLLDWMMPDLDGMEVLRRIRSQRSAVELPVIMVTAKSQNEDVVEALTQGANDYMTKPVDFGVALARVQTQVGRKIWSAGSPSAPSSWWRRTSNCASPSTKPKPPTALRTSSFQP